MLVVLVLPSRCLPLWEAWCGFLHFPVFDTVMGLPSPLDSEFHKGEGWILIFLKAVDTAHGTQEALPEPVMN